VLVAEPSFSSTVLSRIWRSDRNEGAPLTHVEGEILRQFLARLVGAWAAAWVDEGIRLIPEFTMAGSLSMLQPQLDDGRWHIARTVVREQGSDQPLGVLLFCYPEALLPQLAEEARSTLWRSRIERGLTDAERMRLSQRLGSSLRDVMITAPTILRQHMTLGMLNGLERGDVIAFDEDHEGAISVEVLGREVSGRLAAHGDRLALALTAPDDPSAHEGHPPDAIPFQDDGQAMPDYATTYDTQQPVENPEFLAG
jgi:flagellar motor switch protein FliM